MNEQDKRFNKQVKVNEMLERMKSLAKSTIAEFKINFEVGDKREYRPGEHKMTFVPEDINQMTDRQVMAEVLHNIGHAIYTSIPSREKKLEIPKPVRMFTLLANTIEDIRVEEQMMRDYPGVFDNFLYKFRKQDSEISASIEGQLENHMQYVYMLQRWFWGQELLNVKPEVAQALQDSEEYLQEAYSKTNTIEMLEYIKDDLWKIFETLIPPPEDNKDQSQGKNQQEQQLGALQKQAVSIEPLIQKMKELSSGKKPPEGEGEGQGGKEKEDFKKDIDAELDEKAKGKSSNEQRFEKEDEVLGGGGVGYTPQTRETDNYDFVSYKVMYKEILPILPFFVKKLSSIMTDNRYNRQGGNYRTGKLNNKKLYKWKCNSDKVFSKKIIRRHKDYVVSLLIDESGSMQSSQKNRQAAKAVVLFSEVLHKVGIPFEIRGFNVKDRIYKPFSENYTWKHRFNVEGIIPETHSGRASGNNDGFAVNKASYYLNQFGNRDTERILIVLSDGQPASSFEGIPKEDIKRLPNNKHTYRDFDLNFEVAQASRNATCIGIGINANNVQEYYQQNVVCDDVKELPRLVLSKLKVNIRRG